MNRSYHTLPSSNKYVCADYNCSVERMMTGREGSILATATVVRVSEVAFPRRFLCGGGGVVQLQQKLLRSRIQAFDILCIVPVCL